jgi:hypothetical protein
MSLHDDYARRTPIEMAFPDGTVLEELSAEVAREAESRRVDDTLPEAFMTMVAVGECAQRLRGPDAPPEATYPFALLLYHSVHFRRAGSRLHLLDTPAVRLLVSRVPDGGDVRPPAPAGYLQLPQHLMWTRGVRPEVRPADGAPPESVDGIFWAVTRSGMLQALPVSGLLPDRPGFGALPLPPAPLADARMWLDTDVREAGDDFASTLPGAELDGLYEVQSAGEVLKLLARFFVLIGGGRAHLEARPGMGPAEPVAAHPTTGRRAGQGASGAPPPSALSYTRVSLGE